MNVKCKNPFLDTQIDNKSVFLFSAIIASHGLDITNKAFGFHKTKLGFFELTTELMFYASICKEVSIYEFIPECIPEGMRYNKELDKLVPCFDEQIMTKFLKNMDTLEWAKQNIHPTLVSYDEVPDDVEDKKSLTDEDVVGIDLKNHRAYNIGSSNYSSMNIQPWDIWKDWKLDPWDADIVKRISRTKDISGKTFEEARIEDYEKIKHICDEKISQLKEK